MTVSGNGLVSFAPDVLESLACAGIASRHWCEPGRPPKAMLGPAGAVSPEAAERTAWRVLRDSGGSYQRGRAEG